MSAFSNLDTALSEKAFNRGREIVAVNSIGVCLSDSGQPVRLFMVDAISEGGALSLHSVDHPESLRTVQSADFWALI